MTKPRNARQDVVSGLRPHERLGAFIGQVDRASSDDAAWLTRLLTHLSTPFRTRIQLADDGIRALLRDALSLPPGAPLEVDTPSRWREPSTMMMTQALRHVMSYGTVTVTSGDHLGGVT